MSGFIRCFHDARGSAAARVDGCWEAGGGLQGAEGVPGGWVVLGRRAAGVPGARGVWRGVRKSCRGGVGFAGGARRSWRGGWEKMGLPRPAVPMIDLYRSFLNPFDDAAISLDELLDYSTDHLAALTANNPGGQFSLLIAATETRRTALGGKVSAETVQLGIQMARTQTKDDFRAALANDMSKIYGAALQKYGKKGTGLRKVFPEGLEVFSSGRSSTRWPRR